MSRTGSAAPRLPGQRWQGAHGPAARGGWHALRSSRDHAVAGVPTATVRAAAAGTGRRRVGSRMPLGSHTSGTPDRTTLGNVTRGPGRADVGGRRVVNKKIRFS